LNETLFSRISFAVNQFPHTGVNYVTLLLSEKFHSVKIVSQLIFNESLLTL